MNNGIALSLCTFESTIHDITCAYQCKLTSNNGRVYANFSPYDQILRDQQYRQYIRLTQTLHVN